MNKKAFEEILMNWDEEYLAIAEKCITAVEKKPKVVDEKKKADKKSRKNRKKVKLIVL